MITNEEARKAIEKYQKEHHLYFGAMMDVTAISSKEGADIISQTIDRVSKKVDEDTELWCICEMAKMYMQGVKPVYPVRPQGEWNPIKTRKLTEEEKEKYPNCDFAYDCKLPNDDEQVLVTTRGGYVTLDTFCRNEGCYFEYLCDEGDVVAWMPMPDPYRKEGAE